MQSKNWYKIREISGQLGYAQYLEQQELSEQVVEELEIVREMISILINNYKQNARRF